MRLSEGEKSTLICAAYSKTVEKSFQEGFDICSDWFRATESSILADMVADAITEKFRSNIQWALDKDE
jgi:hypothetical protein